ncbi:MAG: hypothetical protein AB8H80_07255 [Planctomycetota bacterium]
MIQKLGFRAGLAQRFAVLLRKAAHDPLHLGVALFGAAFVGAKALDKIPGLGVDRFGQLAPFADFFGLPAWWILAATGLLQGFTAAVFVVAAIRGSRRALAVGVSLFLVNMGFFLVGDVLAKDFVRAVVVENGGLFEDKTLAHICYAFGALGLVVICRVLDGLSALASKS